MTLKDAALEYTRKGHAVIPVKAGTKDRPLVKWKEYQTRRPTEQEVSKWWNTWPDANIALITGAINNLVVFDEDGPKAGKLIQDNGGVPEGPQSITARGRQYLAKHPGYTVRNAVDNKLTLDIRGDGGYIIVSPSVHPSGHVYQWAPGLSLFEVELPELRPWQLDYLKKHCGGNSNGSANPPGWQGEALKGVAKGQRNAIAAKLAGRYIQKGLSNEEITPILLTWNRTNSPPLPDAEIIKTIQSVRATHEHNHPVVESGFKLTDMGNAERFAAQHGQDVRFCHTRGKWLLWDGTRWAPDQTEEVVRKAKRTVRAIYTEASQSHDKSERKKIAKYATSSESNQKIKAMLSLAESEEGIPVTTEQLDADPMLFNCLNGTIGLKTGEFLPHNRRHLITKIAPVRYDPDATCPTWLGFLDRIMAGNQNLIAFIQRAVGYSLTGEIVEQILMLLFGIGANGKTTFIEAIRSALGDYAQQTDFNTFLLQKHDTIRNDLARLKGARLVSAVEVDSGKRLAEVLVKQVTGGDTVTARFLHKEYFEFRPEFKIWLAGNHKPEIRGTDHAIWRRIRLIPFNVTIPDDEQDKELPAKLREELPGILKWAVAGCLEWQRRGLGVPEEVWAATDEYKSEMDILSGFLTDRCLVNDRLKTKAKDLYQEYLQWCGENGEKEVAQRTFGIRLSERGLKRKRGTGGVYFWHGIGLLDRTEQGETLKSEPLNDSEPYVGIPHERDFI